MPPLIYRHSNPLRIRDLCPVFIDYETYMTRTISIRKMSPLAYFQTSHPTALAIQIGYDEAAAHVAVGEEDVRALAPLLTSLAHNPNVIFVAFNAQFDFRVSRFMLGCDYPEVGVCAKELAQAAWPNMPGGYSLHNLSHTLPHVRKKQDIDLHAGKHTPEELRTYVLGDVWALADIYQQALAVLADTELELAALTARSREIVLHIDAARLDSSFTAMVDAAATAATAAKEVLGEHISDVFGWDDPELLRGLRSVKPQKVKDFLLQHLGFATKTINAKQINPNVLRGHREAAHVLDAVSQTNKALSQKRRVAAFTGQDAVLLNNCFFAAHTGRWSGKGDGRGLNPLNMPKHNKAIAEPFRSMFTTPADACWVTGDAANLEYRLNGWVTRCRHVETIFTANLLADPYVEFGLAAIGQRCTKADPIRQVWKMAALGLGFLMSVGKWMGEICKMVAQYQTYRVSLADLNTICETNHWGPSRDAWIQEQQTRLGCEWQIATVAERTHQLFHDVHPEFRRLAMWLLDAIGTLATARSPERTLDVLYRQAAAPDRDRLELSVDDRIQGRSIRARMGHWTPTLCWRDVAVRPIVAAGERKMRLSSVQAGTKGIRALTPSIVLENCVQGLGRNGAAAVTLDLARRGYEYTFNIHDQLLLYTERSTPAILRARDALIAAAGPGNRLGYDWAFVIDPREIAVASSFWEDDKRMPGLWKRIEAHDPTVLEEL